jgi:hypothetical protein
MMPYGMYRFTRYVRAASADSGVMTSTCPKKYIVGDTRSWAAAATAAICRGRLRPLPARALAIGLRSTRTLPRKLFVSAPSW